MMDAPTERRIRAEFAAAGISDELTEFALLFMKEKEAAGERCLLLPTGQALRWLTAEEEKLWRAAESN